MFLHFSYIPSSYVVVVKDSENPSKPDRIITTTSNKITINKLLPLRFYSIYVAGVVNGNQGDKSPVIEVKTTREGNEHAHWVLTKLQQKQQQNKMVEFTAFKI